MSEIVKKKRKETVVSFNHNEDGIMESIIGVENLINKTQNSLDKLMSSKFNKKSEVIEFLYNIDKIELAMICACIVENLSNATEDNKKRN